MAVTWQASLFGVEAPGFDAGFRGCLRRELGAGAWLDHHPGWLAGSDTPFAELVAA